MNLFLQLGYSSSRIVTRNRTLGIQGHCGWEASHVPDDAHYVKQCTLECKNRKKKDLLVLVKRTSLCKMSS